MKIEQISLNNHPWLQQREVLKIMHIYLFNKCIKLTNIYIE